MKYQLVIQFPHRSDLDFEKLVELEDILGKKFNVSHEIDGHDVGSGQMNIFILTNDPMNAFEIVKTIIDGEYSQLKNMKAAYRDLHSEEFICLWPKGLTEFEVI